MKYLFCILLTSLAGASVGFAEPKPTATPLALAAPKNSPEPPSQPKPSPTPASKPVQSPPATPTPTASPTISPASDLSVTARSAVLELAGAFANDGFKVRDGFWTGKLEVGKPKLLEVNLFAGNEYWFSAAAIAPAEKIRLRCFDEKGNLLEALAYEDGLNVAAGLEPSVSGKYFVQIELLKGEPSEFCLIYSYK